MLLPLWVLTFMPESVKESQIQKRWDRKSDESVLIAYNDCIGWVRLMEQTSSNVPTPVLDELYVECKSKLDRYILPQIKRRGLDVE